METDLLSTFFFSKNDGNRSYLVQLAGKMKQYFQLVSVLKVLVCDRCNGIKSIGKKRAVSLNVGFVLVTKQI